MKSANARLIKSLLICCPYCDHENDLFKTVHLETESDIIERTRSCNIICDICKKEYQLDEVEGDL